jgi:hypothetical protein
MNRYKDNAIVNMTLDPFDKRLEEKLIAIIKVLNKIIGTSKRGRGDRPSAN